MEQETKAVDMFCNEPLAVPAEIVVPEIPLRKHCRRGDGPRQAPFVQRHARDHADVVLLTVREQQVLRGLLEDVVNHLEGVDESRGCGRQPVFRLAVIDRYSEVSIFPSLFYLPEASLPLLQSSPAIVPDMKLLEVETIDTEIAEAFFGCA